MRHYRRTHQRQALGLNERADDAEDIVRVGSEGPTEVALFAVHNDRVGHAGFLRSDGKPNDVCVGREDVPVRRVEHMIQEVIDARDLRRHPRRQGLGTVLRHKQARERVVDVPFQACG